MLSSLGRLGIRIWLALVAGAASLRGGGRQRLVHIHLNGELSEEVSAPRLLSLVGQKSEDYFALISLLRAAREDADLEGVLLTIDGLSAGWARLQGLRRALLGLRQAGKHVWVHLNQAGMREYYLASAADRVSLTPAGVLDVAGLSAEATFFLGTLEKLGVRAEVVQMGRYKSAGEPFTRREMSPEHREMIEALVEDLYGQIATAVAEQRHLDVGTVRDLLGRGPFVAREALAEKLIDAVAYRDETEKEISTAHGDAPLIERNVYAARRGRDVRRQALRQNRGAVAVVHLSGTIKTGESAPAASPTTACGSDTICRELDAVGRQANVAAVVLRVDSPGGSGLASDLIWRAVKRLRSQKPVVVSFGDVAASGGYYVAAAGTPVIGEAGTITGSIGVIAGKATLQGLYGQLGITKQVISRGEHASIHSDYLPLGASERERIESEARTFYDDFLDKVAAGRGIGRDAVAAVAEGRVWTGKQAFERGLVDQLGGLEDAIGEAKALAGIPREQPVPVVRLPRPRRHWGFSLLQRLPGAGEGLTSLSPWLAVALRERVWAVAPFHVRFF